MSQFFQLIFSAVSGHLKSQCIAFSSRELSLAAANRASVFFEIGNHQKECLEGKKKIFTLPLYANP